MDTQRLARLFFEKADTGFDDRLNFYELMTYVHKAEPEERGMWDVFTRALNEGEDGAGANELANLFRHYDEDGSGKLEADELGKLVRHMAKVSDRQLSDAQVESEVRTCLSKSAGVASNRFPSVSVEEFGAYASERRDEIGALIRSCFLFVEPCPP